MYIQKIHCFHLRIPLRVAFEQANLSTQLSDSIILRLETNTGAVGYGECAPRTYVSGEQAETVRTNLQRLAPAIYSANFRKLADIKSFVLEHLDAGEGSAAICTLELALLDAWCKVHEQSLRTAIGAVTNCTLPYSGVVPFGSWEQLAPRLQSFRFKQWKLKARADWGANLALIQRVRAFPGRDYVSWPDGREEVIRLDANGSWSLLEAQRNIEQALAQGVTSFEQPVAAAEEAAARELTATYGPRARIVADEALVTYGDAERLIATESYNHFNLKLSKNGGIFNSLRIYRLARQHGIPCQLGAQYGETSLLSAAGALFADLVPQLTAREGGWGTWLLQEDLTAEPLMMDRSGNLNPPRRELGLGVKVDELRLNRYSQRTDYWKKS